MRLEVAAALLAERMKELGDDIRGGGSHQQQVGLLGQFNVSGPPAIAFVPKICHHRLPRKRLQGQGRDELLRCGRHHRSHLRAQFDQSARQVGRLVSGNRAGHSQDDLLARQR